MKRIILLLAILLFSGCQIAWELQDQKNINQLGNHELYYLEDFNSLDSFKKIYKYIDSNVKIVNTFTITGPEETLRHGKGGCGSFSLLFINIAYFSMGIKMDIAVVISETEIKRYIEHGGLTDHALCLYQGKLLEPQTGLFTAYKEIGYIYSFDSLLF